MPPRPYAPRVRTETKALWDDQNRHDGDRRRLFTAVRRHLGPAAVLCPGSFIDIAASMAFDDITCVDVDRRAARFFEDAEGVAEIIGHDTGFRFIHADYTGDLELDEGRFDLVVSLYAGPISAHCTEYLCVGGHLLANASRGDAALAGLDDRYRLVGVVLARSGAYRVMTNGLDEFMVPKQGTEPTRESILASGRGIAYTKPAFAYLFERVG